MDRNQRFAHERIIRELEDRAEVERCPVCGDLPEIDEEFELIIQFNNCCSKECARVYYLVQHKS